MDHFHHHKQPQSNHHFIVEAEQGLLSAGRIVTKKAQSLWGDFKDFIDEGNVAGLAVGIMVGAGFARVISSFIEDVLMPPLGILLGSNFDNLFIIIKPADNSTNDPVQYKTPEQAQADGNVTLNYGRFALNIANFVVLALVLFWVIRIIQVFRREEVIKAKVKCPFCKQRIPKKAVKCSFCASWVDGRDPLPVLETDNGDSAKGKYGATEWHHHGH